MNGGSATCVQFDLSDLNKIYDLSQQIKERWGKLDILISNAAYLHNLTPLSHLSDKDWQISINVNLSANWLLIKHFEKLLLKVKMVKLFSSPLVHLKVLDLFGGICNK